MTKEEFEAYYAANSKVSIERLQELGLVAAPCDCGEEGCRGWQMAHVVLEEAHDDH